MALTPSWPGVNGLATTTDARKALAGILTKDASGNVRSGVFPGAPAAIVTARADMNVDIAAFTAAAVQFGGPILLPNDGVAQLPSALVSPGAGTNYYVLYAKQNESTAPGTDANNNRLFGAQLSATSFALARAALPAGAVELATVEMPTAKTATNQVGVVITATYRFTAVAGGVVTLRDQSEEDAWTPPDGSPAWRIDTDTPIRRVDGAWVPERAVNHRYVRTNASDATVSAGTNIGLIGGTITDAPAGQYLVHSRISVYPSGTNVVGRVYAEWQSGGGAVNREEARWDLPNAGTYPQSPSVQRVIYHPGGNLRIEAGYRRDVGTFSVTSQTSGETVVTAVYLGPGT